MRKVAGAFGEHFEVEAVHEPGDVVVTCPGVVGEALKPFEAIRGDLQRGFIGVHENHLICPLEKLEEGFVDFWYVVPIFVLSDKYSTVFEKFPGLAQKFVDSQASLRKL